MIPSLSVVPVGIHDPLPYIADMTRVQIELSDSAARVARAEGLLTPRALARLLTEEIKRRRATDYLLSLAPRVAKAGIPPMSMKEIDAEVKAVRAKRRKRAGRR